MSVVIAWAAMATSLRSPRARAKSSLTTIAAAAPQVGGQHCSRVRDPKITGDSRTCWTVTGSRKTAYGLLAAWRRDLTAMAANVSGLVP